ncbi:DsbA family protein [bacterium]|jgi:protein-disulfide isomerase|nr:DsbA family protein [bacterium]MBT4335045.1 DsbA family protein [bacterium]MBT4495119.1 DsbA family protein [bacterium]MBT4763871.1 DsbA family protein [bacterium]MBT5401241.1 DsbA family protein [bacterium]
MLDNKQSVFSLMKPTTLIITGIIVGILVASTIGFVVMLAKGTDDSKKTTINNVEDNNIAPTPQAPVAGRKDVVINSGDHILGDPNAPVKIVEFSDFECPFCSRHHPTLKQVMQEYGDQVAWVYKHFPLDSIHKEARPAAEASECVADQLGEEGFWNFTDTMFANQRSLGSSYYKEVASELGADLDEFNNCVSTGKFADKVEDDYQQGLNLGVTGTPGNFINGIEVKGAIPFATLKQIIDSEL